MKEALDLTLQNKTVVLIFDDMIEIAERFQAVLDWFKDNGNRLSRRFGSGAFMTQGMIYFVGADTHRPTRGAAKEFDLRPWASELVRKSGLEARLREKGRA